MLICLCVIRMSTCFVLNFLQYVKNHFIVFQMPCQSVYSRGPLGFTNAGKQRFSWSKICSSSSYNISNSNWLAAGRFNFEFIIFFLLLKSLINHIIFPRIAKKFRIAGTFWQLLTITKFKHCDLQCTKYFVSYNHSVMRVFNPRTSPDMVEQSS